VNIRTWLEKKHPKKQLLKEPKKKASRGKDNYDYSKPLEVAIFETSEAVLESIREH
jgi:hypothetical protein